MNMFLANKNIYSYKYTLDVFSAKPVVQLKNP